LITFTLALLQAAKRSTIKTLALLQAAKRSTIKTLAL